MTDYTELVKALRHLSTGRCEDSRKCELCAIYETCLTRCVLDAADAIEELQAEVEELKAKKMKLAENSLRFVGKVRELDKRRFEPKQGEWITKRTWNHDGELYCSVCDYDAPTEGDYRQVKTNYCPNCGAKMEVQDA